MSTTLPEEICRREERRKSIAHAVAIIEQRHQQAHEEQMRQYKAKQAARGEKPASGKQRGGKAPKETGDKVDPKSQYNFTDSQSRIMKAGSGKHFEQCYNAHSGK